MKKKAVLFSLLFATSTFTLGAATGSRISATIMSLPVMSNGQKTYQNVISYKGTSYVPMRSFGDLLGKGITYQNGMIYVGENVSVNTSGNTSKKEPVANGQYNKNNPAPIGISQTLSLGDYAAKVTVESVERGEAAWGKIQAVNKYNKQAPVGKEYLIAKVKFEAIRGKELGYESIVYSLHNASGVKYSNYLADVLIDDQLNGETTNAGGVLEGYKVYLIDANDPAPKLCYGAVDTKFHVWFSLK